MQLIAVEIELLLRQLEISLQRVVCGCVFVGWAGRVGQPLEPGQHSGLGGAEHQRMKAAKIETTHRRIEAVPGVESPAQAPRSAVTMIAGQRFHGLAQGLQALQRIDGGQLIAAIGDRRNSAGGIEDAVFQRAVAQVGDGESGRRQQSQNSQSAEQCAASEIGAHVAPARAQRCTVGQNHVIEQVGKEQPLRNAPASGRDLRRFGGFQAL